MIKFIVPKVRMTRTDPDNPERQITDYEDMLVNVEHIKYVTAGASPDTCLLTFPEKEKFLVKGTLEALHEKIKELDPF